MNKYTFKDLQNVDIEGLNKIKASCSKHLYDLQNEKFKIISAIMFLENEIEKELELRQLNGIMPEMREIEGE